MGDLRTISLSAFDTQIFEEVKPSGKTYVLNGKNNEGYDYVINRYKHSPTNAAILDSYYSYTYGQGLTANYKADQAIQMAKVNKLFTKDTVRKLVKDYTLFHECSFEVILGKSGNEIAEINHLPKNKVVPNEVDENGVINSYWYSYDWSDLRKYPPTQIPVFVQGTTEKKTVFVIKEYSINDFYFARPSYYSGLNYAELEEQISVYCVNHIKNGLSAGHIINVNEGVTDDEVKTQFERNIIKKWTGANNANKFILSFNSNKDNATTIETITIADAHQQYQFLTEEARKQLLTAHKVVSGAILGIQTATGFSSNADEIETAFTETMLNVITPMQNALTDGFEYVLGQNKITLELYFEDLRTDGVENNLNQSSYNGAQISSAVEILQNVKDGILTKEQAMVFLIQFLKLDKDVAVSMFTTGSSVQKLSEEKKTIGIELINLGEDEDLENYELIECKPVDYDEEEKLSYQFATSTGTANSNRKSIYDTDFYLFRYRYAGSRPAEREFCNNMMSANKIYRREDIEAMGDITVNPGFGKHPNPNNPYSIWKFKGGGLLSANFTGGTCKHYWEKLTYKIKDVKPDVKSPIAIDDAKKDRASGIAGIAPHDI
jgi:hypothetical protein